MSTVYINHIPSKLGAPYRLSSGQLSLETPKTDDRVFANIYEYLQSLTPNERLDLIDKIKAWSGYFNGNSLTPDEQHSKERMEKVYFPVISNADFIEDSDFYVMLSTYGVERYYLEGDLLDLIQRVTPEDLNLDPMNTIEVVEK